MLERAQCALSKTSKSARDLTKSVAPVVRASHAHLLALRLVQTSSPARAWRQASLGKVPAKRMVFSRRPSRVWSPSKSDAN